MENQPTSSAPTSTATGFTGTGEWPSVPPAPAPTRPTLLGPEPPIINADVHLIAATPGTPGTPAPDSPAAPIVVPHLPIPRRPRRYVGGDSPLTTLQRSVRRQQATTRVAYDDLVWQPRFAAISGGIILGALLLVTLPLWIVLFRLVGADTFRVADVLALVMMLMGGLLTSAAAWVIIIEMRGRVRMVDNLAKRGDRELAAVPASPELPVLDAPADQVAVRPLRLSSGWQPGQPPPPIEARIEAQQVSAAATLEASGRLLGSFSSVLKSFGQLWAQVAMLTVALVLFVGATILSVN